MRLFLCLLLVAAGLAQTYTAIGAPGTKPVKSEVTKQSTSRAIFGAGCFWKVQYVFSKVPGVIKTTAGYSGGKTDSPTYKQVCSDQSGHAEVVEVEYDPAKVSYTKLLETFFTNHDPTTMNRQGPDFGSQYRSAIFYTNEAQKKEAEDFRAKLDKERKFRSAIVTAIEPAKKFFAAEDYHQDYFKKHGQACD